MILSGKKKSESYQGKMAVKDRLKELQENSKYYKEGDFEEVEMKPLNPKSKSNFNEFLQSAEEIALGLSEIEKNVGEMRTMQKRILTEPSKDERDKFNAEHSNLLDINKGLGGKVQRLIKNEIESNNKLESKSGMNSNQLAELRLRKTQIATQANRYLEIWSEYSTLQVQFREKTKDALAKNIKITSAHLTTEEIDERLDKGDISVFSSAIIQETAAAKEQLKAIESRHADFLKLEASIRQVHEMFLDVNNLVQMQGEMVTRIEDHVNNAVMDVEKGKENLGKAEQFKKAAMKKKVIFAVVLIVLVIVILLIILSEFGAFSGGGGTTVVNHYIYQYPNGSEIVSDHELKDNRVLLVTSKPPITTAAATKKPLDYLDYLEYEGPGK